MSKLREKIWLLSGFTKKYGGIVLFSLLVTVASIFAISKVLSKLPKNKQNVRVGIVGQFNSNQLPQRILNVLSAGLISFNSQLEPIPNIAENWTVSEDGRTYTFKLFPDKKWSNGQLLTANDVRISIPNIKIQAPDNYTLSFQIPTKFSPFVSLLNIPLVSKDSKVAGDYNIKLKQRTSGVITQVILESSQNQITFQTYPTARQALTAYKLGQVDTVLDLPSDLIAEANGFGQVTSFPNLSQTVLLIFNQTDPNLKEKQVRQSIAYMLKDKSFGEKESLTTINPLSWGYNPVVKTYAFNPQRAKELTKSKIALELSTSPELLKIAENIKTQLDSDIFEINIKVVTSTPEQFQLFLTNFNIPTDPDQYREWHSTQSTNIGRGNDEKIDKLLEDGRIITDQKQRKAIYFDFQKTFAEELPAIPLFHPTTFNLTRKPEQLELFK
ncbi:hypothetical protein A2572_04365 [Candidatus Collierbacteria bacterium RIFOXYD1_FULL_40_9]|uniref:Solute-binding protein family 5 domain-containing protein n=1 Tax=Candidatus Collierbacteria bacterium RIFOXYD1_FULL_40_9 TaxID=1817731 RepID=A0A1F5FPQ5_9BACT|nr:MAG: hypothetical protein A2572_04365 [Candidatus Collierbacteria bacterium RIFOXYD1_FULL_40_9]